MDGLIAFNKEPGESSNGALTRLKRVLDVRKAGFAGTLDPFASGILPVGVGRATRLLEYVQAQKKTYFAELTLGASTDTGDLTGEENAASDLPKFVGLDLGACIERFTGEISQQPPAYSALKVDGERAYALARKGETPTLPTRTITIHSLEFPEVFPSEENPALLAKLTLRVNCSSGTYVRTLGEDIALHLGTVGHLTSLVREEVGEFNLENSYTLLEVERALLSGSDYFLLPFEAGLGDLPRIKVSAELLKEICLGKKPLVTNHRNAPLPDEGVEFAVMDEKDELAAICRREDNLIKPRKVFKPA